MSYSMISEEILKIHKHVSSFLTLLKFLLLSTDLQLSDVNCCSPARRLYLAFIIFLIFTNKEFPRLTSVLQ